MKIAAYCRVSTDKDEQIDSLIHQKEFFAQYAKRNGHELYRVYADEGISGTSLKKREAFLQLMEDGEAGAFQMVVVKDISRFARNTVDALQSIRKLKSMGINTLFLTANMDSMGDSEFVLTLFSAMAQEESNNLSKRVKWGKRINAEKGRVPQSIFGYDRLDNFTLQINADEARIVRKIFTLYNEEGLGCRTVSMALNRDGDKTKYGGEWNPRGVKRVLVNPIYCGVLVNHKYEVADFLTGRQVQIPADERFYHQRPSWAIVTPEVFEKTQKVMEARRAQYHANEPFTGGRYSNRHTFSTLIKCAHCGRSFVRKSYTYTNTRVYWRCVTNDQYTAQTCENRFILDEKELLNALREYFAGVITDREAFIKEVMAETKPPQANWREQEESKGKKLLAKKERYQEMYANGILTMEALKEKLQVLDGELRAWEGRNNTTAVDSEEVRERQLRRFLDMEDVTNVDMRRMVDHISVDKDGQVRIILKKHSGGETLPIGGSSGGAGSHGA